MGAAQTSERMHDGEDSNTKRPVRNVDPSRLEAELSTWEYKINKLNAMLAALESENPCAQGCEEENLAKVERGIHIGYALVNAMEHHRHLMAELRSFTPFRMPSIFRTPTQSVVDSLSDVDIPEQEPFLPSKKYD